MYCTCITHAWNCFCPQKRVTECLKLQFRQHPHYSVLNLRQCLKTKAISVHMSVLCTVAALISIHTTHLKTSITWPFNIHKVVFLITDNLYIQRMFPLSVNLVWGISKRLFYFDVCVQSKASRHSGRTCRAFGRSWWKPPSLQTVYTVFGCNLAPGKLVGWWQKHLVRKIFPCHWRSINTMCRSPVWKHPWVPAFLLLFPPHADVFYCWGQSGLIWANGKVFSPSLWNHNSIKLSHRALVLLFHRCSTRELSQFTES